MKKSILRALCVILALCFILPMIVTATDEGSELPFTDVKPKKWYYKAVKYVYERGIMNGTSATVFAPEEPVTRAMFVTMLARMEGVEQSASNPFTDVDPKKGKWYAGYVGWAADNGIVTGMTATTFAPNAAITREQMAAIIARYIRYTGVTPMKSYDPPSFFSDESKIAKWATSDVDYMRILGIIEGSGGAFDPKGTLTRAQAATVMMRLDQMLDMLKMGDPEKPDYTVSDGALVLMGAWDLYYSGTALSTSYSGICVREEDPVPFLTKDENGQTYLIGASSSRGYGTNRDSFGVGKSDNPLAKNVYFDVDTVMDCIDLAEYPFVRVSYRTDGAVNVGVYAENSGTFSPEAEVISEGRGWSAAVLDLGGIQNESVSRISVTLSTESDMDLRYFAAFRTADEARSFDVAGYGDKLGSYAGEIVEVNPASAEDVDAVIADINEKADAIANSDENVDVSTIKGTVYYISSIHGDDKNDGLSPEKPWRSFKNLYTIRAGGALILSAIQPGDAVLLERGSVFNHQECDYYDFLDIMPGVTYGPYGTGDMPVLTNRVTLDTPAGNWKTTEYPNVWELEAEVNCLPGNIFFVNGGRELWGVMVFPADYSTPFKGKTNYYGLVTNGEESFLSGGIAFSGPGDLKNNLEYFAWEGKLWVYYDKGNPGEIFDEINISKDGQLVGFRDEDNKKTTMPARLQNVALKYTGGCGMGVGDAVNLYVSGCVFEWIGGALQGTDVRYGNAIQNWGSCNGIVVTDCLFRNVYDCGVSTQGSAGVMRNFYTKGCVFDRCDFPFEFFNHGDPTYGAVNELVNVVLTDNYVVNTGVGFCNVRTDRRAAFLYTSYSPNGTTMDNVVYSGNVNVFSSEYAVFSCDIACGKTRGTIMKDNVYYMDPSVAYFIKGMYNLRDRSGTTKTFYPITSQYLTYLNSVGVERGSTFYSVTNPDPAGNR